MAPKKKAKAKPKPESGAAPAPEAPKVNQAYMADVHRALTVIRDTWPDIEQKDALQECAGGYLAPFNPAIYDARRAEGDSMAYSCGGNFFWHNLMMSPMPWVPLDKARVCQLSRDLAPGLLKQGLVVDAHFADGKSFPRGSLTRLSPDEIP